MAIKNDSTYKEMMNTIKQMEETAGIFKDLIYNQLEENGYDIKALEKFSADVTESDIVVQPDENLYDIFNAIGIKDHDKVREICREFHEVQEAPEALDEQGNPIQETEEELDARLKKFDDEWESKQYAWMRKIIRKLLEDMAEVKKTYDQVDDLKKEADTAVSNYVDYISSEEYQKKKYDRLEALKKKAEETADVIERKKVTKLCNELEASMNLSFIAESIERLGEKGYENIKDCFLNSTKSNYAMKKYHEKIEKFGYKDEVYGYFFGIEEKFLDEKYWVFDNLFLFFMIRFIGNADPYSKKDKLYVSSLITNAANLVHQKFSSESTRENYLEVIKNFLNHFEKYYDLFNEKNELHPNHPKRIARKEKQDKSLKEMIYGNLKEAGYDVTDDVRKMSIDELRVLYEGVLDDLEKSKEKQSDIGQIIEKVHLNTDIYKREQLKKKYLKVSDISEEDEEKFKSLPLDELEEFVKKATDDFEQKVCEGEEPDYSSNEAEAE